MHALHIRPYNGSMTMTAKGGCSVTQNSGNNELSGSSADNGTNYWTNEAGLESQTGAIGQNIEAEQAAQPEILNGNLSDENLAEAGLAYRDAADFEKIMRANIVKAAYALNDSGAGFADFKNSRCNERFWILTDQGGFQLRNSVTPADGIRDIFANGHQYAFECATATVIVLYKGVLDSIEEPVFNRLFADLLLYDWHYDPDLHLLQEQGSSQALPGDVLYFANPDHDPQRPEWQGENVVKVGPDLYYGHGIGIESAEAIIDALNQTRGPNATRSAYLTNAYYHPDFSYFYPFAAGNSSLGNPQLRERNTESTISASHTSRTRQQSAIHVRIGQRKYIIH